MSLIPSAAFTSLRARFSAAGEITSNDPRPDSSLDACNHFVAWTFATVLLFVATSAGAQEQAKPPARSVSPDGKWEFRAGAAGEEEDFVIAKAGSDETSLVLSEEEYVDGLAEAMGRAPGHANIVWAPDSKRFAYNLQPLKAYQTAQFYQLDGNRWRKLDSLDSDAGTTALLDRSMARQKKKLKLPPGWPLMTSWQVRKWIDPSTALLYAHKSETFEIKNETDEVNVSFFFTLKFDPAGHWKIIRTRELPAKGSHGPQKIRDVSPDGKFAVRISCSNELEDANNIDPSLITAVDLVSLPSKEIVAKLPPDRRNGGPRLIWSNDSNWLAYSLSSGPDFSDTYIHHLSGERFAKLETEELRVDVKGDVKGQHVNPIRWLEPGVLLLEQSTVFRGDKSSANFQFAVKFDEKTGKFRIVSSENVPSKE